MQGHDHELMPGGGPNVPPRGLPVDLSVIGRARGGMNLSTGSVHMPLATPANVAMQQLTILERERDALRSSMRILEEKLAERKAEADGAHVLQAKVKALQARYNEAAEECNGLRGQVRALKTQLEVVSTELETRDSTITRQQSALSKVAGDGQVADQLKREHVGFSARAIAMEKELSSLRVELNLKEQLLQQLSIERSVRGAASKESEALRERLALAEGRRLKAESDSQRTSNELNEVRRRFDEALSDISQRDTTISELNAKITERAAALQMARVMRARHSEAQQRIAELESVNKVYKAHAEKLAEKARQRAENDKQSAERLDKLQRDLARIRAETEVAVNDEDRRAELRALCDEAGRSIEKMGGRPSDAGSSTEMSIAAVRTPIPGHTLIARLGRGSMGTVYKARQLSLDRIVAVKLLDEKYAGDKVLLDSFIHEARATAKLSHANIISVYTVGRTGKNYYFTMEYVEGVTLKQALLDRGRLEPVEALGIAIQAARGFDHAHRNGIIHRDVKPENLMIHTEGTLKIGDLGIAKSLGCSRQSSAGERVVGTPSYMAPEMALGNDVDHRADIYGLGATLFYMLSGAPPFTGTSTLDIINAHIHEEIPSICERVPELPQSVEDAIAYMMAKDPDDRYQSMQEVIEGLEAAMAECDDPLKPSPAQEEPKGDTSKHLERIIARRRGKPPRARRFRHG